MQKSEIPQGQPIHVHAVAVETTNEEAMPSAMPSAPPQQLPTFGNEGGAREFLMQHQFPLGLQDAFISTMKNLPLRFFIIDDSGSMSQNDGNRFVEAGANSK
ncbi:hypothetical protein B484DRAFT_391786 [Ochromonadaceae sp. CCMP2298]|nr:hypothetical protein B484DRAFT_391786 [Ochromonadaceae sp. CCMP2298]|mmetsp:Transcript_1705/g.3514  ORF Transcript_1705/g.3514 Transcript_1705/m.3514 type:complete len:102 (+) Transcript_1705:48-353(+)